jgi:hypothetical protein
MTKNEKKLREDFNALTEEQKTNVFINYVKMKENTFLKEGSGGGTCNGCPGHSGQCGVCICNTFVPCG